jgi:tetratricopeptide (TPR) repeat protein
VVLLHLGDLAQARINFEKALEIAEIDPWSFGLRSLIHNKLGIIFLSENEVQKALDHFTRSFEELEKRQIGNTKYELDVWRFSAEAYLTKNDTASALDAMKHALTIINSAEGELGIHGAELYTQLSQIEPANRKSHLLAAAECMEREGATTHADYAGILLALGDYFIEADEQESAHHFYENGHRILLQKLHNGEIEKQLITSYSRKAKWQFQIESYGELTKAYWDSSLHYMDILRTRTPFPDSRDNFFKVGNDVYPEALAQATSICREKTKHSDNKGESIFRLIEHSKSFTFTEHLLNQRMVQGTEEGRLSRSRLAEYNFLWELINQLNEGSEKELELRGRFNKEPDAKF